MFSSMLLCLFSFFFLLIGSLLSFILMLYLIMMKNLVIFLEWEIMSLNSSVILMTILIDWMSTLFMSFVLLISSMVIYYSSSYMSNELNLGRFIILVLLFVFSMMMLIISPNIMSILLGWDGLGLVSYCLVIYYQNLSSFNAGMLTALSNRIGDVCILVSISWMLNYGSWNYLFYLEFMKNDYSMMFVGFMLIMAAMTKSAQIPFSSWLPAAMAAPTPVSALVHSSTLVTAGVYLMIRFNILLVDTFFLKLLLLLSSLTMLMAGISANYEYDLKKIIALSTLSQLGLMMSILSMGYMNLAFFHLLTHAMFKALLFMCAGSVIHMMNDKQDIRFMGGLVNFIPLISLCLNVSNMALSGIPFLAGFYSKDLILEMLCLSDMNFYIFLVYYISTGLTMFYTMRLLFYLMFNDFNLLVLYNLWDEDYLMLNGMFILMLNSLFIGSILNWLLFYYPYVIYLPFNLKMMVIYVIFIGGIFGYLVSFMKIYSLNKFLFTYLFSSFSSLMWFLPKLSTFGLNFYVLNISSYYFNTIDMGWIEKFSGQGIYYFLKENSIFNQIYQLNNFKIYMFSFILWVILLIYLYLYLFILFN